jgi:membrane protease YdiL (CAAX protease family)
MGLVISNALPDGLRDRAFLRDEPADNPGSNPARAVPLPRTAGWCAWGAWIGLVVAGTAWFGPSPALLSLLVAPWVEEVLWRRGLQDSLRHRMRPWAAVGLVAVTAAACHGVALAALPGAAETAAWMGAAATAVPIALIGVAYQRYGHLGLCVCTHALANAIWLALTS